MLVDLNSGIGNICDSLCLVKHKEDPFQKTQELPPSNGIIFGTDGKFYLSSIEQNAVIESDAGMGAYVFVKCPSLNGWIDFLMGLMITSMSKHQKIIKKNPYEPYKLFKFIKIKGIINGKPELTYNFY